MKHIRLTSDDKKNPKIELIPSNDDDNFLGKVNSIEWTFNIGAQYPSCKLNCFLVPVKINGLANIYSTDILKKEFTEEVKEVSIFYDPKEGCKVTNNDNFINHIYEINIQCSAEKNKYEIKIYRYKNIEKE